MAPWFPLFPNHTSARLVVSRTNRRCLRLKKGSWIETVDSSVELKCYVCHMYIWGIGTSALPLCGPARPPQTEKNWIGLSHSRHPRSFTAVQIRAHKSWCSKSRASLIAAGFHGQGDTMGIQEAVGPVFFSRHLCRCHTIHIRSNGQPVVLIDGDNAFSNDKRFYMVTAGFEIPTGNRVLLVFHFLLVAEILFESVTTIGLHLFWYFPGPPGSALWSVPVLLAQWIGDADDCCTLWSNPRRGANEVSPSRGFGARPPPPVPVARTPPSRGLRTRSSARRSANEALLSVAPGGWLHEGAQPGLLHQSWLHLGGRYEPRLGLYFDPNPPH